MHFNPYSLSFPSPTYPSPTFPSHTSSTPSNSCISSGPPGTGTRLHFLIKPIPLPATGHALLIILPHDKGTLAFMEDLPPSFDPERPDAVRIARALRVLIDGEDEPEERVGNLWDDFAETASDREQGTRQRGKRRRLGCPPHQDPETEFHFSTSSPSLALSVGQAMRTLPSTRKSTHHITCLPDEACGSWVPVQALWEEFLSELAEAERRGVGWRERVREVVLSVGEKPGVYKSER